jgi:hypothetical protein
MKFDLWRPQRQAFYGRGEQWNCSVEIAQGLTVPEPTFRLSAPTAAGDQREGDYHGPIKSRKDPVPHR